MLGDRRSTVREKHTETTELYTSFHVLLKFPSPTKEPKPSPDVVKVVFPPFGVVGSLHLGVVRRIESVRLFIGVYECMSVLINRDAAALRDSPNSFLTNVNATMTCAECSFSE